MLFYWFNLDEENILFYYATAVIFLNVYAYILLCTIFFLILFNFDTNIFKNVNFFKILNTWPYFKYSSLFFLFSISGLPPFFGFFTKFLYLILSIHVTSWIFVILFLCFNLFVIFFYIQNFKYLNIDENLTENFFPIKNFFMILNFRLHLYINCVQFLNIFSLFFLEFFLNYYNLLWSTFNF